MSTPFYDLASLVVVPSGYKAAKIYAQKPLTTDGQLAFTRASTATRVNASGLIEAVASGVPRLDYLGSTCPRLLLEPQRTNSAQYSEQADNAYWLKYQCSLTANQGVSPDGYTNADLLTMSANGIGVIYRNISTAGAVSCFMKVNSLGSGNFYISVDGVGEATWNANGVKTNTPAAGTSYDGVSYGNGWYRFTYVVSSGTTINFGIAGATTGNSIFLWGMQNEASAAYATSYIPTLGASVTRVADAAYKYSASALIGQTAGTIFLDFVWDGLGTSSVDNALFSIGLQEYGTSNIAISNYNGAIYGRVTIGTSIEATISFGAMMTAGTRYKAALAYANNDVVLYVNGLSYGSDTSASIPAVSSVHFENAYPNAKKVNQALVFKTRLTNAQLAELTAL
jgi:hypothetical protein